MMNTAVNEYTLDNLDELIVDNNFKKLMIIYCDYLKRNYEFEISTGTLINFFKLQSSLDIFNEKEFRLTLKSLLCKNKDQYYIYDELHNNFFTGKVKFNEEVIDEKAKEEATKQAELFVKSKYEKSVNDAQSNYPTLYSKKKKDIDSAISSLDIPYNAKEVITQLITYDLNFLENILRLNDGEYNNKLRQDIEKGLNELMVLALLDENLIDISDLILEMADKVNKLYDNLKRHTETYKKEIEKASKEIEKLISIKNRVEFQEGHNSVKNYLDVLNKNISKLNTEDCVMLSNYIRANASKFKTRISKNMKKDKAKIFDYRATIKKSMKTDGVPLELIYKKPKANKVKIVCILDISGSCIKPAKTMLNFLYELSSVFKGGVRSFVFVRDIAEVSDLFFTNNILTAIEKATVAVPNKGTYSDYNFAFRKFDSEYFNCIDKNTIVLYLGDARNNKNKSGEQYVARIAQKAKSLIWLNTEQKEKWNTGDSIMSTYETYMDEVYEIGTVEDIINFLNTFKIN